MPPRKLTEYSTDELLYELLRLTRRQQWEDDPLRFGCEVFGSHFSKPPAPMHRAILRQVIEPSPRVGESGPPAETSLPFSPSLLAPLPTHA